MTAGPGAGQGRRRVWWTVAITTFLLLGLTFGLLLLAEQWSELERLRLAAQGLRWRLAVGWLLLALLVATADLMVMAAVWTFLYRGTGATIGMREGVRVWILSNLGRYIPGKVWQLGGLAAYMRSTGRSGASALFCSVAFQVLVLATGTATAAVLIGPRVARLPGGAALTTALVVGALLPLLHPRLLERATRAAARVLREPPVEPRRLAGWDLLRAAVALSGAWVVSGIGLWCLFRGLLGTPPIGPLPLAGAFAAAYVAGYIVLVAPGGLVVREGVLAALLVRLGGFSLASAAALAVAARGWAVASELLALAAAMPGRRTPRGRAEPTGGGSAIREGPR